MNALSDRFSSWLFQHRRWVLIGFLAMTAVMAWFAAHLRVDASFTKTLPLDHPYIRTFTQYQSEFGGANRVLIALLAKDGDIFTPEFFRELRTVTDEAAALPGVDPAQVQSLFTPNVRYIEAVEDGFSGGNIIAADFTPTPANFDRVRANLIKSGKLGQLVARDFSGAVVIAQLFEIDPRTGHKLDYAQVAAALEKIRSRVARRTHGAITTHIIGFAKVVGDVREGARNVVLLFVAALVVTALLVWHYAGRWTLAAAPIVCSLVAVLWQLGTVTALGYGIDPFSILVPFLVFAIGVSHGMQKICTFRNEVLAGHDAPVAAQRAFRQLVVPGIVALATDTIGFITMLVIKVETIRELAITASLGVSILIFTNFLLLPILLSFLRLPAGYALWLARRRALGDRVWRRLARGLTPAPSLAIIAAALGVGAWAFLRSESVRIGDAHAGVPELRADSRYNTDSRLITARFSIGIDLLSVLVETVPNGCVDHDVMTLIDEFDGRMRQVPGVQSVLSLATVAKVINAGWNEGSLKWRVLPRNPHALAQAVAPVETSTGLLNADASVLPVLLFLTDHRAETLRTVTAAVDAFAAAHPSPKARFRLAAGNAGVMAATNDVVRAAQRPIVLWIFGAVSVLCLLTFRSFRATLCIVLPLALVSWLAYALMAQLEIGLKTSTLPVVALGVGIGVDYGIYLFARLQNALRTGARFADALFTAFREAGGAIVFTGLTLAIGVSTWLFSALKFQADMGLLLAFMFLVNMLAAMTLLPALACWLVRPPSSRR
ncbi:MMPL family transporter [Horticoccus luteus]|uniref:MMPL family transporter n=1 Tax=Horticoccus luteus TaxID=2862869 RepID=A0A8F9TYE0_9BACT|nr:efflux RND transporter permease subunit [Horticoccus luteus]QYM80134.1 MMPL family transporter [Horticoccus luteus]